MKHNHVMAKVLELESLQRRNNVLDVGRFVEDAKRQNKQRVSRVNRHQPMIAAFVNINDVVAVIHDFCSRHFRQFLSCECSKVSGLAFLSFGKFLW